MNIIGYTSQLSYRPGETLRARFSTEAESFTAQLVRLYLGDPHALGPGPDVRPVGSELDGRTFPGRVQPIRSGSHLVVDESPLPPDVATVALSCDVRPTLVRAGHRQVIAALTAGGHAVAELALDEDARLAVRANGRDAVLGELVDRRWYRVELTLATGGGEARLSVGSGVDGTRSVTAELPALPGRVGLVVAATPDADGDGDGDGDGATDHFNGRIGSPRLTATDTAGAGRTLADWDFGPAANGALRLIANRAGEGFAGHTVNFPLRACLGAAGAPDDVDPRLSPQAYDAIHFHDDDLDDAGWEDDVVVALPADLASGVYGLHVTATDGTQDTLPFAITPGERRRDVLVVLPTLSYLAYSCEHVMADPGARAYLEGVGVESPPSFGGNVHDEYLIAHGLRSLYDVHTDLTGYCFASTQKPLPNIRPDHRWAAVAGGETSAHQFSADLHLIKWLTDEGIDFDVITDEEIHREGTAALTPYRVVLTGSHPEYPTTTMLHAYEDYLDGGGRLMYLGGNGFYWVSSLDPERGHTMEIRRTAGIRAWQPEPGEWHHTTTGELGGLWRLRGKSPQQLVGVGMASQGFDTNRPYDIVADRADPRVAFAFAGLDPAATRIGDLDSMVNGHGAAGVEIDRADDALGTPAGTMRLASATGFSRAYGLDPVEVALPDGCYDGTTSDKVRCDLVLVPKPNGGAVFSTGSIAWCGSLLVNGRDNDVSQLMRNVLQAFRVEAELPFALPT